jgi:hypothetical protein
MGSRYYPLHYTVCSLRSGFVKNTGGVVRKEELGRGKDCREAALSNSPCTLGEKRLGLRHMPGRVERISFQNR